MKQINKIAFTLLLTLIIATNGNIKANNKGYANNLIEYQMINSLDIQNSFQKSRLVDCKLTFENDDGTSLEVTFHDVTLYQCAKMKIGKWIKETF